MELSGLLSCAAGECLIKRVDALLRRVWHYFDTVLVTGLDPMVCIGMAQSISDVSASYALLGQIELALYVRSIGAEDLLYFSKYPAICAQHLDQHAREAGMPPVSKMTKALKREFATRRDAGGAEACRRRAISKLICGIRAALRDAVAEQVKALPTGSSQDVADAVLDDAIRPALARIEKKAAGAASLLAKPSGTSVGVGASLTTVGLLVFAPLVVAGIAIGASGLLGPVNDYLKDQREIRESDMYFLWRLSQEQMTH